jgi:hypothetical protein
MRGITSATSNKPNPRYAHLPDKAESVFNDYDRYLDRYLLCQQLAKISEN